MERVELYDLSADPEEQRDLSREPGRAEDVRTLIADLLSMRKDDRLDLVPGSAPRTASPEELEKLKSLGYVR